MNFVPESNPKIRALARKAARKIKALRTANEAQIAEIYREFQDQASVIKAEVSADELEPFSADPQPSTTDVKQS